MGIYSRRRRASHISLGPSDRPPPRTQQPPRATPPDSADSGVWIMWRPKLGIPLAAILAGVLWMSIGTSGQSNPAPSTKNGEWPHYTADLRGTQVLAARSDQREQLQGPRGRLALQDRQPRHTSRIQAGRYAADGRRRAVHDGRHAPLRRRTRRSHRRAAVGAPLSRRHARRECSASAVRARRRLLD